MKIFKYFASGLGILFLCLCFYEGARVFSADSKTPEIRAKVLAEDAVQIRLQDIPEQWVSMLLKIEDPDFYNHRGVDFSTPGAGMTTLTQAMVKYLYFEDFQPGFAKIEQSLIARFVLDRHFSKEEQLTVFFNSAYLGHRNGSAIRGFPQASRAYFNKAFAELSETEYLSLVAMLVSPNGFNVENEAEKNAQRVARMRKVLTGSYKPATLRDIYYDKSV